MNLVSLRDSPQYLERAISKASGVTKTRKWCMTIVSDIL